MDAHYDQVMDARAKAGQGSKQYFAYSTVLDAAAFAEWKGQHAYEFFNLPEGTLGEALDVALVYDFPSRWWGGRVAGLAEAKGSVVHGRVFTVSEVDWPIISHKEGGVTGMSVEVKVKVRVAGEVIDAVAFATNPARRSTDGAVSPRFVEALVRGARSAGLPAAWVDGLAAAAK